MNLPALSRRWRYGALDGRDFHVAVFMGNYGESIRDE
jgi:hypothetical protein